jgi:3-phenylpropionate/trans-cinnamate dioxygenase ferredoxin subunit
MAGFVEVAKVHDLQEGHLKKVNAGGREIVLARAGSRFFCADNLCPHLGGDLSQGILNGTVITCPMHHSQFDLADGHVIRWTDLTGIKLVLAKNVRPPRPLTLHPVKVDGDTIFAAL